MSKRRKTSQPIQEGDFYINELGLMVFTEQYHKRRGYCCKSGCKHCPWHHNPENAKLKN